MGSYGRGTAIDSTSDFDFIFWLPDSVYERFNGYQNNGQSALLQEVKKFLKGSYSRTEISGDGQVVVMSFSDMQFEIVPAFELEGKDFLYPDTNDGGSWKRTDPRKEIAEINRLNTEVNKNLKLLCQMVRAWKVECGISISGLLIDTLCYNYVKSNQDRVSATSFSSFHTYVHDFFLYLSGLDDTQAYWRAPGSNQNVYNDSGSFKANAATAHGKVLDAISKKANLTVNDLWREVFGPSFPAYQSSETQNSRIDESDQVVDNEEFIEDRFPVSLAYNLKIDCMVTRDGFRTMFLASLLSQHIPLNRNRSLKFFVVSTNVPGPYTLYWKVRNIGDVAIRRNCLRGSIVPDKGAGELKEHTSFHGPHFVECYAVKNGVCVARARIDVPIC